MSSLLPVPKSAGSDLRGFLESVRREVSVLAGQVRSTAGKVEASKPLTMADLLEKFPALLVKPETNPDDSSIYEPSVYADGVFATEDAAGAMTFEDVRPLWVLPPIQVGGPVWTDEVEEEEP